MNKAFAHGFGRTEVKTMPDGGVAVAVLHAEQILSLTVYSPDMAEGVALALIDAVKEVTDGR